jgi:hypothetical protein
MDIIIALLLGLLFASVLTGPVRWRHSRTESAADAVVTDAVQAASE